jgi:hypothetical protein
VTGCDVIQVEAFWCLGVTLRNILAGRGRLSVKLHGIETARMI